MKTLYPSLSNRSPLSRLDGIFLTTWSEAVPSWSGMHRHLRSESLVHYNVTITQDQDPGMTLKQRLAFYKWSASRVSKPLCEGTDKMWIYKFCWHYILGYIWTIVYCFFPVIKVIRVEWISKSFHCIFCFFPIQDWVCRSVKEQWTSMRKEHSIQTSKPREWQNSAGDRALTLLSQALVSVYVIIEA